MKKILLLLLLWFIFSEIFAQEKIEHINYSANYDNRKSLKATQETLELPFFDDFSDYTFYPNNKKWIGKNVFVNNVYPINPPSLGVATLDAIKNTGKFYSSASYGNRFSADTLCSLPLNLNYANDKTIYLSFYYQAQGLGDNPEEKDSLILEFYAPDDSTWYIEWSIEGSVSTDFKQVMINIEDSKYLKEGFKFRFRNIASLSGNNAPSKAINSDHWHLDYIYLDKDRSEADTNPRDIAFIYPMQSFLKHYEAMPWKHFLINTEAQLSKNTNVVYQNNDNQKRHIDSIYYEFIDEKGKISKLNGGSYDIESGKTKVFNPPYSYGFLSDAKDSVSFTVKAKFITDEYDKTINNTLTYYQRFYDYYAYDDGTAEASYGLTGDGAQRASLAYKFNCVKKDTLKSVQMYFCRSLNNKSKKYFHLTIWNDKNGKPGEIVYQKQALLPEYENELNKFHTYYIVDTALVLQGVFYIGWVQTTSDMLNIGMDFNKDNQKNILYRISNDWQNSKYKASLMIRPFFGKQLSLNSKKVEPDKVLADNFVVYPNPASSTITVKSKNIKLSDNYNVVIYNLLGKALHHSIFKNNQAINIEHLTKGVYILKITGDKKHRPYFQKFVKK